MSIFKKKPANLWAAENQKTWETKSKILTWRYSIVYLFLAVSVDLASVSQGIKVPVVENQNSNVGGTLETQGVNSKAVIKVKVIELLLDGEDEILDLARHFKQTRYTLKRNSGKIARFLKNFEEAGEIATNEVRT